MVVGEKHLTTAVVHFIQQLYRQEHEQQQQQGCINLVPFNP
jgi:hypothetical protein